MLNIYKHTVAWLELLVCSPPEKQSQRLCSSSVQSRGALGCPSLGRGTTKPLNISPGHIHPWEESGLPSRSAGSACGQGNAGKGGGNSGSEKKAEEGQESPSPALFVGRWLLHTTAKLCI